MDEEFRDAVDEIKDYLIIDGDAVLDLNFIESIVDLVENQHSEDYQMDDTDLVMTLRVYVQAYKELIENE